MTREELAAWLDRKPPPSVIAQAWACWFAADGEYLGERSARTGPDDVGAAQRCLCEVCNGGDHGGEG